MLSMSIEPNVGLSQKELDQRFRVVSEKIEIAGRHYEFIRPQNADDLISEEEFDCDERLPYWADLWASSIVLAERVAAEAGSRRSLLELGCGIGLVATVAASVGFAVTATDYYADALDFTRLNTRHNRQQFCATRLVDWRDFPADLGRFDLVVASDVLYEPRNVPLVAAALEATLTPNGLGFVADPKRRHAMVFPEECRRCKLKCARVAAIPIDRDGIRQTIDLFEIRPSSMP
jgi:predicted nicotinamide N-methyase